LSKQLPKFSFPTVKLSKSHANNLKKKNEKLKKKIAPDVKKSQKNTTKTLYNSLCVKLFFMGNLPKVVVENKKSIPSMCSPPNN
jgi:hypothetical protein